MGLHFCRFGSLEGNELKDLRGKNIHPQTHHKHTARLLLSLCALDVYLQMCLSAWMANKQSPYYGDYF